MINALKAAYGTEAKKTSLYISEMTKSSMAFIVRGTSTKSRRAQSVMMMKHITEN